MAGFALAAISVLFALQSVFVCLTLPSFMAMYKDFGAALPGLTQLASDYFVVWLAVALAMAMLAVVLAKRRLLTRWTVIWLGLLGLLEFVLAQSLTLSLWVPIGGLSSVFDK